MWVWHLGSQSVSARIQERLMPVGELLRQLNERHVPRVPGTAVFLTRAQKDAPPELVWHVKNNRDLNERVFILKTVVESVPRIWRGNRLQGEEGAPGMFLAIDRI